MKLGLLTVPYSSKPLEEILPKLKKLGVKAVELGTGGFTDDSHCKVSQLLADEGMLRRLQDTVTENGMEISALSCHANPVHPDKDIAVAAHRSYEETLELASKLQVDTVVTFSGCPGGSPEDTKPNWVTCPWPNEFSQILDYQWNDCLLPYWEKAAALAERAGIKVAIEMHPGFSVYNTETLLRLREAAGPAVGANFDPSHLFWQGMDAVAAIKMLGSAIHYVHAKDCRLDMSNIQRIGVLDVKHYSDELNRAWVFCTVGYGHDEKVWRDIISALRMIGYSGTISIEHEDSLMSIDEGINKAVEFLKPIMIYEEKTDMWWA